MANKTGDTVEAYMQEVLRLARITAEDEVRLAEIIQSGEEAEAGEAREKFITANLRLVIFYAKRAARRSKMDLADLIQEGNIGLMKALAKFDHTKGYKFSTYASWWIKQSMQRAVAVDRTIKIPLNKQEQRDQVRQVTRLLNRDLGREPTDEEIAAFLEVPAHNIEDLRTLPDAATSLHAPVSDEGTETLEEIIPDDQNLDVEHYLVDEDLSAWILGHLRETLPERDYQIYILRFGLEGEDAHSLEQIGKIVGLTRERVRQIIQYWSERLERKLRIEYLEAKDE